jgi:uncharacterized protein (UPF0332 family)
MDEAAVYLAKATESLLTAESEFVNGRYNSCANRCYYSCFQSAIAALLREGIRARSNRWGHDYVQAQFVGQLVNRRKRYDAGLRRVLADNQALRDQADYHTDMVGRTETSRALNRSRKFLQAVQREVTPDEW